AGRRALPRTQAPRNGKSLHHRDGLRCRECAQQRQPEEQPEERRKRRHAHPARHLDGRMFCAYQPRMATEPRAGNGPEQDGAQLRERRRAEQHDAPIYVPTMGRNAHRCRSPITTTWSERARRTLWAHSVGKTSFAIQIISACSSGATSFKQTRPPKRGGVQIVLKHCPHLRNRSMTVS